MDSKKANTSIIVTSLAAALGYGGWAVYVNYEHGVHAWMMAGAIQGTYAFLSTLFITHIARIVYLKCGCKIRGILTGFGMSFLIMLAIPLLLHNVAGTPNIWQTILPGLIWGSIYLIGFLVILEFKDTNAKKNS